MKNWENINICVFLYVCFSLIQLLGLPWGKKGYGSANKKNLGAIIFFYSQTKFLQVPETSNLHGVKPLDRGILIRNL